MSLKDLHDPRPVVCDFNQMTYVEAIWFVAWHETDWFAVVYKDLDGVWCATHRFRYWNTADPWDRRDKKTVYTARDEAADANAGAKFAGTFDSISALMQVVNHGERWKMPVRGTPEQAAELLKRQPWVHTKVEPKPRTH
jgi:hypothetical protein